MPRQVIDSLRAGRCMRRLGDEKADLLKDVMISPTSCAVLQETKSSPAKRKRQHQPSVGGLRRKVTRVGGRVAGLCTVGRA